MVEMSYEDDHINGLANGTVNSCVVNDGSTIPPESSSSGSPSRQVKYPIMSASVIVSTNPNGDVSTLAGRRLKTRPTGSTLGQRSASLKRRDGENYQEDKVADQVINNGSTLDVETRNLSDVQRSCSNLSAVGGVNSKIWGELQKTAEQLSGEAEFALKRIDAKKEEPEANGSNETRRVPDENNTELKKISDENDSTESYTALSDEKLPLRPLMQTSLYELCPAEVFDSLDALVATARLKPAVDGGPSFSNDDDRKINCGQDAPLTLIEPNSNGSENTHNRLNSVSSTSPRSKSSATSRNALPVTGVRVYRFSSSSDSEKGKDEESENEMIFRPTLSKYGYPQTDSKTLVATYNPFNKAIASETGETLMSRIMTKRRYSILDIEMEDDFVEGMNIFVNEFDACDDIALSEADCPQPSRLSQLQWALWRQKNKYFDPPQNGGTSAVTTLNGTTTIDGPPNRVCCSLM